MRRFPAIAGLLALALSGANAGLAQTDTSRGLVQLASEPKPAWAKRSGNPAVLIAPQKWNAPGVRPPKPRTLTAEQKQALPPPDWVYVYRPSTGEVRLLPPAAVPEDVARRLRDATPSNMGLLGYWPTPTLEIVIGDDTRQRVTPTTDFLWRTFGKLYITFPNQSLWSGSGGLTDPYHVLTAGHNVHNSTEGGWATQIEFLPGMDGNWAPFSSAWDYNVYAPSGWVDSQDTEFDIGLITLDRNVGAIIGWLGYAYENLDYYAGRVFNVAGYPGDRDQGLALYWSYEQATRATENVLYHLIDTAAGESGAPIWRYVQPSDSYHIMAVHTYGNEAVPENSGSRINAARFANLNQWRALDPPPHDYADLIDDGEDYAGFNPTAVTPGAFFQIFCDVRNIGTTEALAFNVSFHASTDQTITPQDPLIGTVHVPSVFPFTYVDVDWSGTFPSLPLGTYYLGRVLDSGNHVDEINENDNTVRYGTPLVVGTRPNINLVGGDFSPASPTQLAPGQPVTFSASILNDGGSATGSFWLEFWGSRTGGLMIDLFLGNSVRPGSIAPGATLPFSTVTPLASIPDGPYTVVILADRPGEIAETNERDNKVIVGAKRLLLIRPQTNADMAIQGFSFSPTTVMPGQPITLGGLVRNLGTQDSGPFWIEFWGSFSRLYPSVDFMLCDSIAVNSLPPGQSIDLSRYTRSLYATPPGTFMVGVVVDRLDQVSEREETNNYLFLDGYRLNQTSAAAPSATDDDPAKFQLPDLVLTVADFAPYSPYQAPPGAALTLWVRVENRSSYRAGDFWLEFWGSRTGGLTLDELVADSLFVPGLDPWAALDLTLPRSLYSIPDGPYSIIMAADRPGMVGEANEGNNRLAVAGKRLLTIRPQTQANLVPEAITVSPTVLHRSQPLYLGGRIRNAGTQNSGPFWIEFFGTRDPNNPTTEFFLCESIPITDLAPGASVSLSAYTRYVYPWASVASVSIIAFVDRTDMVNETHEEDNYVILSGYSVSP